MASGHWALRHWTACAASVYAFETSGDWQTSESHLGCENEIKNLLKIHFAEPERGMESSKPCFPYALLGHIPGEILGLNGERNLV